MRETLAHQDAGPGASRVKAGGIILATFALSGVLALTLFLNGCATAQSDGNSAAPEIYDPQAEGEQQLAAALAEAKVQQKRVLLSLGANWCSDSQSMHRLLKNDRRISRELNAHYVLVLVDVNKRTGVDRNAALVTRLGDRLTRGIPVLLVLGADGALLNTEPAERLADSDHKRPGKVLRYLQKWSGTND